MTNNIIKDLEADHQKILAFVNELEQRLIISNGHAYCMLLRRHIEKEDTVVYPFAKKHLSEEIFAEMIKENQNY